MSKFSEQERERILSMSREILSRDLHPREGEKREDCHTAAGSPLADLLPIVEETRNARHIREIAERDERWERERRRERARDDIAVDRKIAALREELRADMIEIAQAVNAAVKQISDAIAELEQKADAIAHVEKLFSRLESKLNAVLPRERGVAVDHLPNPLAHRVN
jgi:hypothetical protein